MPDSSPGGTGLVVPQASNQPNCFIKVGYNLLNYIAYGKEFGSLCVWEETQEVVDSFYLVSMAGEIKDPTQQVNV